MTKTTANAEANSFAAQNEIAQQAAAPKHELQNKPIHDEQESLTVGHAQGLQAHRTDFPPTPMVAGGHGAPTGNGDSVLNLPEDVKKNILNYNDLELNEMLTLIIASHTASVKVDRIIFLLWSTYNRSPKRIKVLERLRFLTETGVIVKDSGVRGMYQLKKA